MCNVFFLIMMKISIVINSEKGIHQPLLILYHAFSIVLFLKAKREELWKKMMNVSKICLSDRYYLSIPYSVVICFPHSWLYEWVYLPQRVPHLSPVTTVSIAQSPFEHHPNSYPGPDRLEISYQPGSERQTNASQHLCGKKKSQFPLNMGKVKLVGVLQDVTSVQWNMARTSNALIIDYSYTANNLWSRNIFKERNHNQTIRINDYQFLADKFTKKHFKWLKS